MVNGANRRNNYHPCLPALSENPPGTEKCGEFVSRGRDLATDIADRLNFQPGDYSEVIPFLVPGHELYNLSRQ